MSSQAWNLWDIRDVQDGYPQYVGSRLGSNTSRLALDNFLQVNGLTVLPLKYHFYVAIFICRIKANTPAFQTRGPQSVHAPAVFSFVILLM
jgi:hypothetical protein